MNFDLNTADLSHFIVRNLTNADLGWGGSWTLDPKIAAWLDNNAIRYMLSLPESANLSPYTQYYLVIDDPDGALLFKLRWL